MTAYQFCRPKDRQFLCTHTGDTLRSGDADQADTDAYDFDLTGTPRNCTERGPAIRWERQARWEHSALCPHHQTFHELVPAGDASEHLVHRLLLALAAHPDGATVVRLQADLGPVPPEALDRRLRDLCSVDLAGGLVLSDGSLARVVLTSRGRARAAAIQGAPWPSSRSTPAPEPRPT